jgi:hypothetical protein
MEEKSKNTFYLDPYYKTYIPRKSPLKLESFGIDTDLPYGCFIPIALFSGCMSIVAAWLVISMTIENLQFNIYGIETLATINTCEMVHHGSKVGYLADVTYNYNANDQNYTGFHSVPSYRGDCDNFPQGTQWQIQYLPYEPSDSQVIQQNANASIWLMSCANLLLVGLAVIMAGIALGMGAEVGRHTIARFQHPILRRKGILLTGNLIAIKRENRSVKYRLPHHYLHVTYEFETPDGRLLIRNHSKRCDNLRNSALPEPGTPVDVLYANDFNVIML